MIYLDNAATTKVFDCAVSAAVKSMTEGFFNPNATYKQAVATKRELENSRRAIADIIGVRDRELFFTSCATESNNWVFDSVKNRRGNIVISAGEHSSVYEPAMALKNKGADVRIVPLTDKGIVDETELERIVDGETTLVSIIHVSNETGTVNPIKHLSDIVKRKAPRALIHSDGVQGFIKTRTSVSALGVDMYSASAHKIGAPKGIGLLYVKDGKISPMLNGGGQENGKRSGTQNTPYIAAFAAAVKHYASFDFSRIKALRDKLAIYFSEHGCTVIGGENSGFILCVYVPGIKAEILQNAACERGVIVGKGSACSGSKRGNRVLSAMGMPQDKTECCIRLSLSVDTDDADAMKAAEILIDSANRIRSENV